MGGTRLLECAHCSGLWVNRDTFTDICSSREKQATIIGDQSQPITPLPSDEYQIDKVRYVPCPQCRELMNRVNFAQCSGVILDICKNDGVWFDQDELRRIVEFIRAGGMEKSRARQCAAWEAEKRAKEFMPTSPGTAGVGWGDNSTDARELLETGKFIIDILVFVARLFLK